VTTTGEHSFWLQKTKNQKSTGKKGTRKYLICSPPQRTVVLWQDRNERSPSQPHSPFLPTPPVRTGMCLAWNGTGFELELGEF